MLVFLEKFYKFTVNIFFVSFSFVKGQLRTYVCFFLNKKTIIFVCYLFETSRIFSIRNVNEDILIYLI
jgi:hypothetical protein